MAITIDQIKELRKMTGAGMTAVKEALENSNGDVDKAVTYLREKGLAKAAKRAGNEASNGFIGTYVHGEGNMAVSVELNSETDFTSRNETFRELARELAIHIAAAGPLYIDIEDIPADVLEKEKAVHIKTVDESKPENVKEMIIKGKLEKWYEEVVLMKQKYVKDDTKTVEDVMNEAVAAIGEKIIVGSFSKLHIGQAPYVTSVQGR